MITENAELPTQLAPNASAPDEVLDTRTPEEIEKQFLDEAEAAATQAAMNRPPEETAAIMFHMFYPQFRNLLMGLSNKELRRVLAAIVGKGHSSEPETPLFHTQKAGTAYKMGLELLSAKFMMIQKLELDAFEKAHQEQEAKNLAAEAVITEERGEAALESEGK